MHTAQDIILSFGSLVFIAALVPTILGKDKPALATSLMTAGVLLVFAGVYISLDLWFSALTTFATAACWITLAAQKKRQGSTKHL